MLVVALELSSGSQPAQAALTADDAGRLVELVGRDLATFASDLPGLDLVLAAAHFDPAEILRPGWPVHQRLDELLRRAPQRNQGPRLIAFGADAGGEIPLPLQAQPDLQGGALRVLPVLISGDAGNVERVANALEEALLERGMAAADTALLIQQAFGARVEHVRFLTHLDLAAMMSLQYQHQNLGNLWPLIETALLAADGEEWLDLDPEPLLLYRDGQARMALLGAQAWRKRHGASFGNDAETLARGFEYFQARQRQLAAVLEAHGIPVTFVYCDDQCNPREMLAS